MNLAGKTWRVTCTKCLGDSVVSVNHYQGVEWRKTTKVISARQRLDGYWGWQCTCGNNSIITPQEEKTIDDLASPHPEEVKSIVRNLEQPEVKETSEGTLVDGFLVKALA